MKKNEKFVIDIGFDENSSPTMKFEIHFHVMSANGGSTNRRYSITHLDIISICLRNVLAFVFLLF